MIQHINLTNRAYLKKEFKNNLNGREICDILDIDYITEFNTWNKNNRTIESFKNFLFVSYELELLKNNIIIYKLARE